MGEVITEPADYGPYVSGLIHNIDEYCREGINIGLDGILKLLIEPAI